LIEHPRPDLFDSDRPGQQSAGVSLAEGRGHAVFFDHHGLSLVLKHYQRGGKMAMLLGDKYIGSSCERSRSFREWRLLQQMRALGLPVPQPVAAGCTRHGLFYRADLVTLQINHVVTLADHLLERECDDAGWLATGACIRRFHDAGIFHADLNARNILFDARHNTVHLIDFDKGCFRHLGESWKASNLARLQRSLLKFKSLNPHFNFEQNNWNTLLQGYNSGRP
jgi:3-deoxy-D-manno-octulosonic acid kinase